MERRLSVYAPADILSAARVGEDFSGVEPAPGAQAAGLCSVARAVIGSGVRKQVHYSHYSSTALLRCLRKSVFVSPHRQRDICTSAGRGPRSLIGFSRNITAAHSFCAWKIPIAPATPKKLRRPFMKDYDGSD